MGFIPAYGTKIDKKELHLTRMNHFENFMLFISAYI